MTELHSSSYLPIELWRKVISNLKSDGDLVFLWTSARNVSHGWREIVDEWVSKRHLPRAYVVYFLMWDFSTLDTHDSNIAIFVAKHGVTEKAVTDAVHKEKRNQKEAVLLGHSVWTNPFWYVGIRRMLNDTELPGLKVDWKTMELRCDWRGMFTAFLYEEKLSGTLTKKWSDGVGDELLRSTRLRIDSGELNKDQGYLTVFQRVAESMKDNHRTARRRRIERQLLRDGIRDERWIDCPAEIALVEKLEDMRIDMSWVEFSDDEEAEAADTKDGEGDNASSGEENKDDGEENEDSEEDIEHGEENRESEEETHESEENEDTDKRIF